MTPSRHPENRFEMLHNTRLHAVQRRRIGRDPKHEAAWGIWLAIAACYVAGWFMLRWLASAYPGIAGVLAAAAFVLGVWLFLRERYHNKLSDRRAGIR